MYLVIDLHVNLIAIRFKHSLNLGKYLSSLDTRAGIGILAEAVHFSHQPLNHTFRVKAQFINDHFTAAGNFMPCMLSRANRRLAVRAGAHLAENPAMMAD